MNKYCNLCICYSFREKKKKRKISDPLENVKEKSDIILFSLHRDILALRWSKYIIIPLEKWMNENESSRLGEKKKKK